MHMTKDCYTVHRLSEDPNSKLPKRLCMTPDEGAAKHLRELALRISLGWNIATRVHVPPAKKMSKEALASSRTKRMKTRIRKKYGFFAEDFIAEGIAVGACETLNRILCKKPSILRALVEAAKEETPEPESDKAVAYIYAVATCKEVAEDARQ